jgi:ferredoxin
MTAPRRWAARSRTIPDSRIPQDVVTPMNSSASARSSPRAPAAAPDARRNRAADRADFDFVVIAAGAQKPAQPADSGQASDWSRPWNFCGRQGRHGFTPGKRVVIIGAGNVGCDVASEAAPPGRPGDHLLDVQQPASFGKEREAAEAAGAQFRWPVFTKEITAKGVKLNTGEVIPGRHGDHLHRRCARPGFLPRDIVTERGFMKVNDHLQTSDPKVFAIGDAVKPGLLTDAIGAGRKAAAAINAILATANARGRFARHDRPPAGPSGVFRPPGRALSRTWRTAAASAPPAAPAGTAASAWRSVRRRHQPPGPGRAGVRVRGRCDLCIGCGFCAGACPCGIWDLVENDPLG